MISSWVCGYNFQFLWFIKRKNFFLCGKQSPVTFSLGINSTTTGWLLRRERTSTWPPPPYWKNQIKNTSSRNYFILLRKFNCQTANFNINQRGLMPLCPRRRCPQLVPYFKRVFPNLFPRVHNACGLFTLLASAA